MYIYMAGGSGLAELASNSQDGQGLVRNRFPQPVRFCVQPRSIAFGLRTVRFSADSIAFGLRSVQFSGHSIAFGFAFERRSNGVHFKKKCVNLNGLRIYICIYIWLEVGA